MKRMSPRRRSDSDELREAHSGSVDGGIVLPACVLVFVGIVMSYSGTAPLALERALPPLFLHHLGASLVGIALALVTMRAPLRVWRLCALPLWAVGVVLLIATLLAGVEVNGATRWFAIPGLALRFQPAELAKLGTLLAVATVVAPSRVRGELATRHSLLALGLALPPIVLLLLQPDFGNAVLLGGLVGLVLVAAGIRLRRLILPTAIAGVGIALYLTNQPYAWRRVSGFLDPWAEYHGAGFQLVQSFIAFGQGGLLGVGLGGGSQKLFYLPEAHTDFVLALVAEELGLVGVLIVLGAFAALLFAGTRIAGQSRDRFGLLLAFSMTMLLTLPAMVNAAVVMGLMPTKGLTLPFLSYGRTSLVICFLALGILLGTARQRDAESPVVQSGRSPHPHRRQPA